MKRSTLSLRGMVTVAALLTLPAWAQQPTVVKDCTACPELLRVPPGSFLMGASEAEEEREEVPPEARGRAAPQHRVTIGYGFWMGRTPVTRNEFAAFVAATKHNTSGSCWGLGDDRKFREFKETDWRNPGFVQAGRHPAVCVFWADAVAYAAWLTKTTGKTYRLPSEAEWEYVARAGTTAARFWGDGRDDACRYANTSDQTLRAALGAENSPAHFFGCRDGHVHTAPAGAFASNPWDFHDMLGNVWQWTQDCVHETYQGAPDDGRWWDGKEGGNCEQRVARGGSWSDLPAHVRAAARGFDPVGLRFTGSGFRVVRVD